MAPGDRIFTPMGAVTARQRDGLVLVGVAEFRSGPLPGRHANFRGRRRRNCAAIGNGETLRVRTVAGHTCRSRPRASRGRTHTRIELWHGKRTTSSLASLDVIFDKDVTLPTVARMIPLPTGHVDAGAVLTVVKHIGGADLDGRCMRHPGDGGGERSIGRCWSFGSVRVQGPEVVGTYSTVRRHRTVLLCSRSGPQISSASSTQDISSYPIFGPTCAAV